MAPSSSGGWDESAQAWLANLDGDFARLYTLDAPMLARATQSGFADALDVGCGEGRFCRKLQQAGLRTTGIDPTETLLEQARRLDPVGSYVPAYAEALPFPNEHFDLVVSYLSLIDIPDIATAIPEMARVLRPGGALLIANLNSFVTASNPEGWRAGEDGRRHFKLDHYGEERADWVEWAGINVQNWHRPLETYMQLLLGQGLQLTHFAEPLPVGGPPERAAYFQNVPWFHIMEWRKPKA
jgi:SAM-dependent methyltransferase